MTGYQSYTYTIRTLWLTFLYLSRFTSCWTLFTLARLNLGYAWIPNCWRTVPSFSEVTCLMSCFQNIPTMFSLSVIQNKLLLSFVLIPSSSCWIVATARWQKRRSCSGSPGPEKFKFCEWLKLACSSILWKLLLCCFPRSGISSLYKGYLHLVQLFDRNTLTIHLSWGDLPFGYFPRERANYIFWNPPQAFKFASFKIGWLC